MAERIQPGSNWNVLGSVPSNIKLFKVIVNCSRFSSDLVLGNPSQTYDVIHKVILLISK